MCVDAVVDKVRQLLRCRLLCSLRCVAIVAHIMTVAQLEPIEHRHRRWANTMGVELRRTNLDVALRTSADRLRLEFANANVARDEQLVSRTVRRAKSESYWYIIIHV